MPLNAIAHLALHFILTQQQIDCWWSTSCVEIFLLQSNLL